MQSCSGGGGLVGSGADVGERGTSGEGFGLGPSSRAALYAGRVAEPEQEDVSGFPRMLHSRDAAAETRGGEGVNGRWSLEKNRN